MAARTRTAVLCNNHFSKGGGSANNRMIGSVAFINYCRAGFIVTPDAGDDTRLLLMPSKMNIAPIKHGLAYRIESVVLDGQPAPRKRFAADDGCDSAKDQQPHRTHRTSPIVAMFTLTRQFRLTAPHERRQ